MYQASEVERFAPGHHGYPRASEADYSVSVLMFDVRGIK